jgi:diguanylate cyclase (GGDEF)-like protein
VTGTSGWLAVLAVAAAAVVMVAHLVRRGSFTTFLPAQVSLDDATEVRYRQLATNLPHGAVIAVDRDLRLVLVAGPSLVAAGSDLLAMEGHPLSDALDPRVTAEFETACRAALTGESADFDSVEMVPGSVFRTRVSPMLDSDGAVVGALIVAEDVTAERAVRDELATAKAFGDAVLSASPDITTIIDLGTGEASWESRSMGVPLGGTTGRGSAGRMPALQELVLPEDIELVLEANARIATLADGESITVRYRARALDGTYRWISRRTTPFTRTADGAVVQGVSSVRDVTDIVAAEEELRHHSLHDPLTGLANRVLLLDRVTSALDRAERAETRTVVLFCDLDGFKRINDSDGHAAGDAVLVEVAHRLQGVLRLGDSIARVGGDEFVILLDPTTTSEVTALPHGRTDSETLAKLISERIRAALDVPIVHEGRSYVVSVSIGVTVADRGSTAESVLRDADTAMYRAKLLGRNRVEIFDADLRARALERSGVENALRLALDTGRPTSSLTVAYQPVHDLATGRLVGFEALARLLDEDGVSVSPDAFIPVAEDTGLISALGARVLDEALGCLVRWRAAHTDETPATMAVNLSARQAQRPTLSDEVRAALGKYGLAASDLVLELTESVLLESASSTLRQLTELHDAGVSISIDDFGTGYASLRYLTTLPVNSVKVDRSFTAGMVTDRASASIVRAVAALAADLDLACIVEGIETIEQLVALPSGVQGQGFLLGRPHADPAGGWLPAPVAAVA